MRARYALMLVLALLAGCSRQDEDAPKPDASVAANWTQDSPMDGEEFGAPAVDRAERSEVPRPDARFDLTEHELAALSAVLAEDYTSDAFDPPSQGELTAGLPSFRAAKIDLDGDGIKEVLTLLADSYHCGSGGCTFRIYTWKGDRLRKVSGSTITRLPIAVTDATTAGWRNLTVFTCGGGIDPCGRSRLEFDGASYPLNPTMPPAVPTEEVGTVVLAEASPVHRIARPRPEQ